jgi:integrase
LATIVRLKSGNWRVQVRRKGRYISETFKQRKDAEDWALDSERRIDRGEEPRASSRTDPTTFGHLIDLHLDDMQEVGKCARRSKAFSMERLKKKLGNVRIGDLNRERLVAFGRDRAREGAGPPTIGADLSYVKTILSHAAAVHGTAVSVEPVDLARIALKRLGLIGKAKSRDRRPTQDELDRIISYLEGNPRQYIPAGRLARFAIATAMRLDEICHLRWQDVNAETKTVIIRDRKDPRNKTGNHQKVPLLDATGIDAWAILEEQKSLTGKGERIFPYSGPSVGTAFRRACQELGIDDLHFHDLRHEAASRLFEAGFTIEQVALVTGHRDWKMLRRYTHLRPEDLHLVVRAASKNWPSDRTEKVQTVTNLPQHSFRAR